MTDELIVAAVAESAGVDERTASIVIEEFLLRLHKLEYENNYKHGGLIENIWHQLSERAFYHLLGFLESRSENSEWEAGTMNQYLGRMPPDERWERPFNEMMQWRRSR